MRHHLIGFGIDHAQAPIALRERLAFTDDTLPQGLAAVATIAPEALILSTCNRLEVYALLARPDDVVRLRRTVADLCDIPASVVEGTAAIYEQQDAVSHLFRVACGLESQVLGEPQILAQVRDALAAARQAGTAGPILSRLAMDALRVGKQARTETGIARNRLSVAHAAVDLAAGHLGGLSGRSALVVGAGKTGTLAAKLLREARVADLVIANRTAEHGQAMAQRVGARFAPLAAVPAELRAVDAAFAAVTAPGPVIAGADLAAGLGQRRHPLIAVDLGVPRNIAPALGQHPLVRLFDVDDLRAVTVDRRVQFEQDIRAVEAMVAVAAAAFDDWRTARQAAPTIAALRARGEQIRAGELERALRKLGHLSERDRNVVEALSVGLVNKLLHEPIVRLRDADEPGQTANAVADLFRLGAAGTDASAGDG